MVVDDLSVTEVLSCSVVTQRAWLVGVAPVGGQHQPFTKLCGGAICYSPQTRLTTSAYPW